MSDEKKFSTTLANVNESYLPMIERQLDGNNVKMDDYSKTCVLHALGAINSVLDNAGVTWNDKQLDKSNVTQILLTIASLKLNASAQPREVYFQVRNVRTKQKDEHGKDVWKKQIEYGIEGDGNDAILARFGRDVKKVGQFWIVREGDKFEYPSYNGLDMTPPKWQPTGKGNVVRVVYPVVKKDNTIEFYISERDDVIKNLFAHIRNNMMNETFGICEDRYKATADQKKKIADKKAAILKKVEASGLDCLKDPELASYISPAWLESSESMIIRKMRNNAVKPIPKDFGNAFIQRVYDDATDDTTRQVNAEIAEHANSIPLEADFEEVDQHTGEVTEKETEPQQAPESAPEEPQPADDTEAVPDKAPEPPKDKPKATTKAAPKTTSDGQVTLGGPGF